MPHDADLLAALAAGDAEQLRTLVGSDASLASARDESGRSAVLLAQYAHRADLAQILLEAGPPLDVFDAAALGETAQLAALLDEDSGRVHARSGDGFNPLHYAAYFGHLEAARLLLE